MKKLMILLCLSLMTGCTSQIASTGSGGVSGGGGSGNYDFTVSVTDSVTAVQSRNFICELDNDAVNGNGALVTSQSSLGTNSKSFGFTNIPSGNYYLRCYKDIDNGGALNTGDSVTTTANPETALNLNTNNLTVNLFLFQTM